MKPMPTSRRAILAGLSIVPALGTAAPAASSADDPIFAAIKAHLAARAAYWDAPPGETDEQSDERLNDAMGPAEEALVKMLTTRPTTIAGCVAALRHIHEHIMQFEDDDAQLLSNSVDDTHDAAGKFLLVIATALANVAVQS
jgi:hypothetical protein